MELRRNKLLHYLYLFVFIFLVASCSNHENTKISKNEAIIVKDSLQVLMDSILSENSTDEKKLTAGENALRIVEKLENDSIQLRYLSTLSFNLANQNKPLLFREINNRTIQIAQVQKDSVVLAEAYWDLAIYLEREKALDSTFYFYDKALNIYSRLEYKDKMAYLFLSKSGIQQLLADYAGAEQNIIKALEFFKQKKNNYYTFLCYSNLGTITHSLGDNIAAIKYYQIAESYLDSAKIPLIDILVLKNSIGIAYKESNKFVKADSVFSNLIKYDSFQIKEPVFYAKVLVNYSNVKVELKSKVDLNPNYLEAIAIAKKNADIYLESTASGHYGEYLAYKQDTLQAIEFGLKAIQLAEQSENNAGLLRNLNFLTLIDKKNASSYAQQYFKLNKKIQEEERTLRDKFARVRFQTDEFIEKNELLAKQNNLLRREKQLWSAISFIGLLAAIAVIIIILQHIKNRNLVFKQQQQESNQEIFNLLLKQQGILAEGKKIEQERISQELHDGVLNKMLGIRLVLIGLNKKNDPESIEQRAELIKDLAEVSEEIRTVSHELSNAAYQNVYNFIESIKALIEGFRKAIPETKFNFKYKSDFKWDALDGEMKINIYRILQECIQNAIKHANASSIFINFDATEDTLAIRIKDNGKGFDVKKVKKGIGFRNISSRLKKWNGVFEINSTFDLGTKLWIKLPIIFTKQSSE